MARVSDILRKRGMIGPQPKGLAESLAKRKASPRKPPEQMGLTCASCQGSMYVTDSRRTSGGTIIRRRRACIDCGERVTTHEVVSTMPPDMKKFAAMRNLSTKAAQARRRLLDLANRLLDLGNSINDQEPST